MEATFVFDGRALSLRLSVEGEEESAVAKLMESFTQASVSVEREHDRYGYRNYNERPIQAVNIVLVRPLPKPDDQAIANELT